MWNAQERNIQRKAAYAGGGYAEVSGQAGERSGKCSRFMAMLLGIFLTVEIMVAGAMVFDFDFHGADGIALFFVFVVLYAGVVALLTDK